ncbi:MAG: YIP1 family protein [Saccharospirillaceae bacterium]|nr:YIP1 family protein [Pseudomonadales bacterium]NRB80455.1 YIP1 family protein [Saccharospirillaceae bacterium]
MSDQFYTPANENMEIQSETKPPLHLLKSLLNMFVSPKEVFDNLPGNGASFWLPSSLIGLSIVAFMLFYMNAVLPVDMVGYLFLMEPELENTVSFEQMLVSYPFIKISFIVAPLFLLLFLYLITAFIFYISSNIVSYKQHSYLTWMAFNAWVYLPTILVSLVQILSFINLGGLNHFVALTDIEVMSVNNFFLKYEQGHVLYAALTTLNPFYIWTIGLSVYGFKVLTNCNWLKTLLVNAVVIVLSLFLISKLAG